MTQKPYIVAEWHDTQTGAVGWLCIYNFVKNYAGGGTRMHPTVTREEVIRLATTMGYKYRAAESVTTGGCKGGIAYDYKAPDAKDVLRRYIIAMAPYIRAGASVGGDLGVDYADVLRIYRELGLGLPQTKAMRADPRIQRGIQDHDDMCGMTYDGFLLYDMITGYGCAFAADEGWKFKGGAPGARVVIQGFGCVGASMAKCLVKLGYKVVGVSDANCLVTRADGLDVDRLIATRKPKGELDPAAFGKGCEVRRNTEWLDVDCDILIPAALEDVIHHRNADQVKASLICEAANIPISAAGEEILRKKGVDVCVDFVANLGAIRFYDAIIFGLIEKSPQAAVDDVERIIRRNTRRVFEEARRQGRTQRQVALELFAPEVSDTPDL